MKVRLKLRGRMVWGRTAAQQRETLEKMSKILMIQTSGLWQVVTA